MLIHVEGLLWKNRMWPKLFSPVRATLLCLLYCNGNTSLHPAHDHTFCHSRTETLPCQDGEPDPIDHCCAQLQSLPAN